MGKKYLVEYLDKITHKVNYHEFFGAQFFSETENKQLAKLDLKRTNKDVIILGVYARIF